VVDTWWQTETGGIMITPSRGHPAQPGSQASFFRVEPLILRDDGTSVRQRGRVLRHQASLARLIVPVYGKPGDSGTLSVSIPGFYFTGDARKDDEATTGSGRVDM